MEQGKELADGLVGEERQSLEGAIALMNHAPAVTSIILTLQGEMWHLFRAGDSVSLVNVEDFFKEKT